MVVAADVDSPQQNIPKNQQNDHHQVNWKLFLSVKFMEKIKKNEAEQENTDRGKRKR